MFYTNILKYSFHQIQLDKQVGEEMVQSGPFIEKKVKEF